MFELTIGQKILLAEKVMGWLEVGNKLKPVLNKTFFFVDNGMIFYKNWGDLSDRKKWQPETDKGDAAELMLALPAFEVAKFLDGTIRTTTNYCDPVYSGDFCESICRLALAHAEELKNESNP